MRDENTKTEPCKNNDGEQVDCMGCAALGMCEHLKHEKVKSGRSTGNRGEYRLH